MIPPNLKHTKYEISDMYTRVRRKERRGVLPSEKRLIWLRTYSSPTAV